MCILCLYYGKYCTSSTRRNSSMDHQAQSKSMYQYWCWMSLWSLLKENLETLDMLFSVKNKHLSVNDFFFSVCIYLMCLTDHWMMKAEWLQTEIIMCNTSPRKCPMGSPRILRHLLGYNRSQSMQGLSNSIYWYGCWYPFRICHWLYYQLSIHRSRI